MFHDQIEFNKDDVSEVNASTRKSTFNDTMFVNWWVCCAWRFTAIPVDKWLFIGEEIGECTVSKWIFLLLFNHDSVIVRIANKGKPTFNIMGSSLNRKQKCLAVKYISFVSIYCYTCRQWFTGECTCSFF